ncbi:MAG TPA: hypothetical protein VGR62_16640 [Candidatus Binatia bacterium]|nr:hypothetical protein [Candidatus Binatia bacterium]
MRRPAMLLLGCALALTIGACSKGPKPARQEAPAATPAPAGSPLSEVKEGMRPEEVQKILGAPSSIKPYITGKAFIPFYFGPDQTRTAYYYKGVGRVVFSGDGAFSTNSRVQRVEYDPTDPGYPR